jgi:hypothetical protein
MDSTIGLRIKTPDVEIPPLHIASEVKPAEHNSLVK